MEAECYRVITSEEDGSGDDSFDGAQWRGPCKNSRDIPGSENSHGRACCGCCRADVGEKYRIGQVQQSGMNSRFVLVDVESGAGEGAVPKCVHKRGLVDESAAGGVYEEAAGLHPAQRLSTQEVVEFRGV